MKIFETLRLLSTRPDLWALIQPEMLAMLREWGTMDGRCNVLDVTLQRTPPMEGKDGSGIIIRLPVEEEYKIIYTIPEPECFKAVDKRGTNTTMRQVLLSARANYTNTLLTPEIVENSARIIIGDALRNHKIETLLLTE